MAHNASCGTLLHFLHLVPRYVFAHVVEKVSINEAKELFRIFFSGCHLFIPICDVSYDSYDGLKERSPWTFDTILAVAGEIKSGNKPPAPLFYKAASPAFHFSALSYSRRPYEVDDLAALVQTAPALLTTRSEPSGALASISLPARRLSHPGTLDSV